MSLTRFPNHFFRIVLLIAYLAGLLVMGGTSAAYAATIVVTNTNDSGSGSLRQAIVNAISGDTITFTISGTITLTSGELAISKNLTMNGPGASSLTISGGLSSRVFNNSANLTLSGLAIQNGNDPSSNGGGGIFNSGTLTLINSLVANNKALLGGGIYNNGGVVTITDSTISNNRADVGDGGGIYNASLSQLQLTNTTISSNFAENIGGGILSSGMANITNSTISGNQAKADGAIRVFGGTLHFINDTIIGNSDTKITGGLHVEPGTATNYNTILALNTSSGGSPNCSGSITSEGNNLLGNNTGCNFVPVSGDQVGTGASPIDPKVSPLQANGGPTLTHALLPGSPAIDQGNNISCPPNDQRGVPRPQGLICDIGAFELTQAPVQQHLIRLPLILRNH